MLSVGRNENFLKNKNKTVAVGCNIDALRYSFAHAAPLVYVDAAPPHRFTNDKEEWHHLYFCLSLSGLIVAGDKVSQIRIVDDCLRITSGRKAFEVHAKEFLIFDGSQVQGLAPIGTPQYEVLDWINVRSGMKHDFETINLVHDFIEKIIFYPSDRIDGAHKLKDACVISKMSPQQLQSFDCSELMTRLKAEEAMKRAGIKGAGNGVGRHLPIKLESNHREVFPINAEYELPVGFSTGPTSESASASARSYLNYLMGSVRD